MYDAFAEVYDELMGEVAYGDWADYVFRNFLNGRREVKRIMEFGCGTGNITIPLAQKGLDITAVDLSEEMMTVADEKADDLGLKSIRFYLGDMANFQIDDSFDAVIACCDTVNYLASLDDFANFLLGSKEALAEDGLLLFDMNTSEKYKSIIEDKTYVYDMDNVYCVWESEKGETENSIDFNLTFFSRQDDGRYLREDEGQRQYIYKVEDIYHLLKQCGYADIKVYTFGTFMAGGNESGRVQFCATKA